jgi:hypothetical protein
MTDFIESCGATEGCSGKVEFACNCGNPVIFLCKGCTMNHLSEPYSHLFISLEQARELIKDQLFSDKFGENIIKYGKIKSSVYAYIRRIQTFKHKIEAFKSEVISMLELECQSKLQHLDKLQESASNQLIHIKKRMKSFTSFSDDLLSQYESKGLNGVLEDYTESLEIHRHMVQSAISNMISISLYQKPPPSLSETPHIYFTRNSTKELVSYNLITGQPSITDLSSTISANFNYSSTCLTPDGNVMIVGGSTPSLGDTYKFHIDSQICTQLSGLNNPRGWVHLTCAGKYLYAFGGCSGSVSNKAERMEWDGNGWENLPDMKEPRFLCGSCLMGNKIYLFGGQIRNTIEYFDIERSTFTIVPDISIDANYNIVSVMDDSIYIIDSSQLTVMDKEFKIQTTKGPLYNNCFYNLSNTFKIGKDLLFYSHSNQAVMCFDTELREVRKLRNI